MQPEPSVAATSLTPRKVLNAIHRIMMKISETNAESSLDEPFPIEISELFLYSPDGESVLLVFQFLGNECVLSETSIALERRGEVVVLKEQLQNRALEFLVLRLKTLKEMGF